MLVSVLPSCIKWLRGTDVSSGPRPLPVDNIFIPFPFPSTSAMSQPCAFVDPSSLSLPSSSSRLPSPACSLDESSSAEPPRKRPRSAVTPEERKEARAHRNRIAAQNSRDRRKAQFVYLERRVAELEDENRRLRAGILAPSITPSDTTAVEREQEQQRKREEEQRERENKELRERIRSLEMGYEAVVRALAAQGNLSASGIPTPPPASPAPTVPSHSQSSLSASNTEPCEAPLSIVPSLPLSPTSSNSTLESPLLLASGDSFDFSTFPASETSLALPQESLDLSLANNTSTRHLARVANTAGHSVVSLQRVGGAQMVVGPMSTTRCRTVMRPRFLFYSSVFSLC